MQFDSAYSFLMEKLETEFASISSLSQCGTYKRCNCRSRTTGTRGKYNRGRSYDLKNAALFHDSGFLETYSDHEEISCEMARKWLPQFGYNKDQIEEICNLIMGTKIPQQPKDKLGEILCDADLYYLGTDKYFIGADKLYKELHEAGLVKNREEWGNEEIKFVESHHYFTPTAQRKFNSRLKQTVLELKVRSAKQKKPRKGFGDQRVD